MPSAAPKPKKSKDREPRYETLVRALDRNELAFDEKMYRGVRLHKQPNVGVSAFEPTVLKQAVDKSLANFVLNLSERLSLGSDEDSADGIVPKR